MQSLAATVWRLRPELVNGDASVGELAWVHARAEHAITLWPDGDGLAAWSGVDGDDLVWQVQPDRLDLLAEVLESSSSATTHACTGFDLTRHGFVAGPEEPWTY